jgi:hypothetical protein
MRSPSGDKEGRLEGHALGTGRFVSTAQKGTPSVQAVLGANLGMLALSKHRVVREYSISSRARLTRLEISASSSVPLSVSLSLSAPKEGGAIHTQYGCRSERATMASAP